jgi:hypothetical protein
MINIGSWLNSHKALVLALFGLSIIILLITSVLVLRPKTNQTPKNEVTVVSFNDGSNEVIIDRSGKVIIKTPFGTFTQFWDKEKIRSFFENIDNLDFDTLVAYVGTEAAISLTGSNGQTILIDSSLLPEGLLGDLVGVLEETYETEQITVIKTTPPPLWATPNPTGRPSQATTKPQVDNPWHTGVEPENAKPFTCEAYSVSGGRRVIVSQTLCGK